MKQWQQNGFARLETKFKAMHLLHSPQMRKVYVNGPQPTGPVLNHRPAFDDCAFFVPTEVIKPEFLSVKNGLTTVQGAVCVFGNVAPPQPSPLCHQPSPLCPQPSTLNPQPLI